MAHGAEHVEHSNLMDAMVGATRHSGLRPCPHLAKGDIRAHSRAPDRGTGFDRAAKLAAIPAGEGRDYGPAPTCLRLEELNAGNGDALFFLRRQSLSQI